MTASPELSCPRCSRVLQPESWMSAQQGSCTSCQTDFEFVPYPALRAVSTAVVPQAAEIAADSVCFFHGENRAEVICEGCGRLLCPVCAVPFGHRTLCPACIAVSCTSESEDVIRHRPLYDVIAMTLALAPLLMWPFTLVTAPLTLGLVVFGWNKPGSLVRGRSRVRFVLAALIAVLQIAAWIAFFITVFVVRRRAVT